MKILLANSSFHGGGVTTYATHLAACLAEDAEMTVVLGEDKVAPITNPKVNVIYRDAEALTVENALFFIDLINNVLKPDVVISSLGFIIPVIAPYLNNHVRVFTVSHSGMNIHSDYCAVNHHYLDRVIAASSDYNKAYLEHKFHIKDKSKVQVLYNFVGKDKEIEDLRFKKCTQNPFSIVFAGGYAADKSPELVAKIVEQLLKTDLDFRFYWTGNLTIPLTTTFLKFSKLKTVPQMMPSDKRLIFPGRIPDKRDYDKLLGGANIMLAPSKNEGCSMAVLEGHRAGCIFVVADYKNSNCEIVKKGNSGFVINHNDVDAFVEIIKRIIINHSDYFNLYENSHDTYEKYLSYPVWRDKLFSIINSEANHKNRKSKTSRFGLYRGIWKVKWLRFCGQFNHLMFLSLPSYLSFRRQFNRGSILMK